MIIYQIKMKDKHMSAGMYHDVLAPTFSKKATVDLLLYVSASMHGRVYYKHIWRQHAV